MKANGCILIVIAVLVLYGLLSQVVGVWEAFLSLIFFSVFTGVVIWSESRKGKL
jgi:hypothetical protein